MTTEKCTFYSFSVDFCKSVSKMEMQKLKCCQQNSLQEERSRPVLARTIEMLRKGCCCAAVKGPLTPLKVHEIECFSQWRRHGGAGGKRGNLPPPPQPPIGHPVRSMQIRGDSRVRKNGDRFTGFARNFCMHRRYGERSLVVCLRKRGSCGSC